MSARYYEACVVGTYTALTQWAAIRVVVGTVTRFPIPVVPTLTNVKTKEFVRKTRIAKILLETIPVNATMAIKVTCAQMLMNV